VNTHSTIEGLSFLCSVEVSSSITIEELLGNGVSVEAAPRLYNEDPRESLETAEDMAKKELGCAVMISCVLQ
jgi:hypothetical protein